MNHPTRLYQLLLDHANCDSKVTELSIGLVWTVCRAQGLGLAMSPGIPIRTLPWPGTIVGRTLGELSAWLTEWEPYQATVGMAAVGCSLNRYNLPSGITLLTAAERGNLAVFEHFLPQLVNKKVVVIGHYPGIERYADIFKPTILERQPQANDLPDPASEFLLPDADWVFLTAISITNKTFPRLAELAKNATTVLMGPTLPWFPQWHEFGIDYLAGIEVVDPIALYQTAAEGGGVRIFENGARYRIVALTPGNSMAWLKTRIAEDYNEKQQLTAAMEHWYASGKSGRFPQYNQLQQVTTRLSHMDSSYKRLWDAHPSEPS
ncbi:MAG: DUF364 domain-containing protein [Methylococcales bacterium]|nr:DUF364 domain-containing protein [Methylococcales bacterium]